MSKNIKKVLRKKKRTSQTLPIIAMLAALGVSSLTYSVSVSADTGTGTTETKTVRTFDIPKGRPRGDFRAKPVAAGVIESISGSIVTIKDRSGNTYTVDVSTSKILQGGRGQAPVSITVADLKVGDMLGAQGTLAGTHVTATEVMTGSQHPFMKKLHKMQEKKNHTKL